MPKDRDMKCNTQPLRTMLLFYTQYRLDETIYDYQRNLSRSKINHFQFFTATLLLSNSDCGKNLTLC